MRDLIERHVTERTGIAYMQRAIQVVLGNMIDTGDPMNSHPRINSAYISRLDLSRVLLEMSHCLNGTYGSKDKTSQYEEQQKTEKGQFGAFTQH